VSHAGDGNFHLMLILDPGDVAEMDRARRVVSDMVSLAHGMGGTCTGAAQPTPFPWSPLEQPFTIVEADIHDTKMLSDA